MANPEEVSSFAYDVFLSFRGDNTRHNFVAHLRKELSRKGINTFFDDEKLRIGEDISPALSKAIKDSKICIIVFSEHYATSTWCLAELVEILDCCVNKTNSKQLALPIFYHVDPSDVRKQKNSFEEAMLAQETKFGKDSEKVRGWRSALEKAANLKGLHIRTDSGIDESTSIEKIVKDVYAHIPLKPLHNGEDTVGLEEHIEQAKSLLNMKPNDDTVSMLGIYGPGGIGKTELAKTLYDKIVHQFEAASFLADVREKSNMSNGIENLQKTLLSEMKEELDGELGSSSKGSDEIKCRLQRKKVLLILDDVDDIECLEQLAGKCNWFGPGSRIIITTRDEKLLKNHDIEKIYKMVELNDQHSLELFCRKAFKQSHPESGFEVISSRVVRYAKGLPLALKVLGSDLAKSERILPAWECALKEYERAPNTKIQDVLKISYEKLGSNAKQVFLDIACFFKGKKIQYVKDILDASYNIDLLRDKSLLSVDKYDCLEMHDLIQDMGRAIVMQKAPYPRKRNRIWSHEDAIKVLTKDSGSGLIEGIMLDPPQRKEVQWSGDAFEKLTRLRILIVRNTSFSSEPKKLPNSLWVLDWDEYPSNSFPQRFSPEKITAINLRKSNLIKLNLSLKAISHLKYMNLSRSHSITEIGNMSSAQNLRELTLDDCTNLIKIDQSVGFLKNLSHLSVSGCTKLRNFPPKMFLPSLENLCLDSCTTLEHFPDVTKEMKKGLSISMLSTSIKELPDSIGNLTGLEDMLMSCNRKLKYVPSSLFMLSNVEQLDLYDCCQLGGTLKKSFETPSAAPGSSTLKVLNFEYAGLTDEDLQAILNFVPKLEELSVMYNKFVSLPAGIKDLVYLTELNVNRCYFLKRIPECPKNLRILHVEGCMSLEDISELPSTVEEVHASGCCSLSRETSNMLWSQVSKEKRRLHIWMPINMEIPEWFDYRDKGGNPRFWARGGGNFPIFALALIFHEDYDVTFIDFVDLDLFINGRCVHNKVYGFDFAEPGYVLLGKEEWLGLEAFLEHDWNQVEFVCKGITGDDTTIRSPLSSWGFLMYRSEGTNMEHVQFICPHPNSPSTLTAPTTTDPVDELVPRLSAMMQRAENMYYHEEEVKLRKLKAILNNLITPQNFVALVELVKAVNIDSVVTLTGVVSQIFEKALMEPWMCEIIANFCLHLSSELPDFSEDNKKITFKRLLLNKCQKEFESNEREDKARRRMLENTRFIGELYKKKMLTERIMHECIKKLLGEEDIEALCMLMSTIGKMIDHPKAKEHMDAYFVKMNVLLSSKMDLCSTLMLKDVIDLRNNNWQRTKGMNLQRHVATSSSSAGVKLM